jgi:hypothetical protein
MMKTINLYLAAVWLMLASGVLLFPQLVPPEFRPYRLQMAVFAAVLCSYNLTRWWLIRLQARYQREADERYHRHRYRHGPVDPTFDLDEPDETEGRK